MDNKTNGSREASKPIVIKSKLHEVSEFPSVRVVTYPINHGAFYIAQSKGRDYQANTRAEAIAKACA